MMAMLVVLRSWVRGFSLDELMVGLGAFGGRWWDDGRRLVWFVSINE